MWTPAIFWRSTRERTPGRIEGVYRQQSGCSVAPSVLSQQSMGPTDEELVEAFQGGDAAAFDVLVRRWDRQIQGAHLPSRGSARRRRATCARRRSSRPIGGWAPSRGRPASRPGCTRSPSTSPATACGAAAGGTTSASTSSRRRARSAAAQGGPDRPGPRRVPGPVPGGGRCSRRPARGAAGGHRTEGVRRADVPGDRPGARRARCRRSRPGSIEGSDSCGCTSPPGHPERCACPRPIVVKETK